MFVLNRGNYDFVTFVQHIILVSNLVDQNDHCQKYDNANQMRIFEIYVVQVIFKNWLKLQFVPPYSIFDDRFINDSRNMTFSLNQRSMKMNRYEISPIAFTSIISICKGEVSFSQCAKTMNSLTVSKFYEFSITQSNVQ